MKAKYFYSLIFVPLIIISLVFGFKLAQIYDNNKREIIDETGTNGIESTSEVTSGDNENSGDNTGNSDSEKTIIVDVDARNTEKIRITAVGDVMLGRGVGSRLEKKPEGYAYAFEKVADILNEGDIVFCNLEGSITDRTHSLTQLSKDNPKGKYVLRNKVAALDAIKLAGFNMISLANNHILDYYDKGLFDTFEHLDANGIAYSGAGNNLEEARMPAIVEKKGIKVGLLSYSDMAYVVYNGNPQISFIAEENKVGIVPRKLNYILEDIEKVREEVDILLVSLHWGTEESFNITPEQIEFAHTLIDAGADAILGHHPHQFQGIEIYKDKPIIYSMGNFIFDQNDPENQESFILNMDFSKNELLSINAIPVRTIEKSQVVPQFEGNASALLDRQAELSNALSNVFDIKDDKLVFEP